MPSIVIIYMATNIKNGKKYIGQTVGDLAARRRQHKSNAKKGRKGCFHSAIRKYGIERLAWTILYYAKSIEELNAMEEYYIAAYETRVPKGYNIMYGGDNKRHSLATKEKIRAIKKGDKNPLFGRKYSAEHRKKIGDGNRGKVMSVTSRLKMSCAKKGKKLSAEHCRALSGRSPSVETRMKQRAAMTGKKQSAETRAKISTANRAKARVDMAGEKNHSYDHEIYAFRHPEYGLAFCQKYELRKEFSLRAADLGKVVAGKRKSVDGWSLASPEYLQNLRKGMGEIVNEC